MEIDESICLLVESSENTKNPVENPAYNSRNYATHTLIHTHTHTQIQVEWMYSILCLFSG